jgi:hypothetical protein
VIVPDINLLIYAYNADAPLHEQGKSWWEDSLNNRDLLVGLPWLVSLGFIRIMTHPRILVRPLSPEEAVHHTLTWLMRPNVEVLIPGERHLDIFLNLVREIGHAGSLTTDLHIAALAIEHHATVCSNDADFIRFSGLKITNPIV